MAQKPAAKGKGKGLLSKPPEIDRLKARLKAGEGNADKINTRINYLNKKNAPAKKGGGGLLAPRQNSFLSRQQNALVNRTRAADLDLQGAQQGAIDQAIQNTQQPFDFSQFERPDGPDFSNIAGQFNPQDWNRYRQEQIDLANQDFEARMGGDMRQQMDDFEQQMMNRGIPMGSQLYNQEKTRLEQSQADARRGNLLSAMGQGAQNASAFGNLAMTARSQGINDASNMYGQNWGAYNNQMSDELARRYQPLNEANLFRGAQSPMLGSDAQYGNQAGLQQQQIQGQMQVKRTPGGGGGGAAEDPNNYRGTGMSFNDYLAATTGAQIAVNNATPKGQSINPWWGVAGAAAAGLAS
jgi:hypothetical protein